MPHSSSRSLSRERKHKKRKHKHKDSDLSPKRKHYRAEERSRHSNETRRAVHDRSRDEARHHSRSTRFKLEDDVKPRLGDIKLDPDLVKQESEVKSKQKKGKRELYLPGRSPEPERRGRLPPGALKHERDWSAWERNRTREPRDTSYERRHQSDDRRRDRSRGVEAERRRYERERVEDHSRKRREMAEPDNHEEQQEGNDSTEPPKEEPNFGLSGKLTEDTNTFRGVVIKYNEPAEARKPKRRWRLYPFKGDVPLDILHIHRQSAYLFGRDRRIADIPVDHPSCSKQHAVLQYRAVPYERPDGTDGLRVRPYVMDLGSANKTFLNNKEMDPQRYYELQEKDVIKFGFSTREYVVLHEKTDTSELADDVNADDVTME